MTIMDHYAKLDLINDQKHKMRVLKTTLIFFSFYGVTKFCVFKFYLNVDQTFAIYDLRQIIFPTTITDLSVLIEMISNGGFSGRCFKWQITPEFEALEWMSSSRC